jgi:hypothetical protein
MVVPAAEQDHRPHQERQPLQDAELDHDGQVAIQTLPVMGKEQRRAPDADLAEDRHQRDQPGGAPQRLDDHRHERLGRDEQHAGAEQAAIHGVDEVVPRQVLADLGLELQVGNRGCRCGGVHQPDLQLTKDN